MVVVVVSICSVSVKNKSESISDNQTLMRIIMSPG